MARAPEHSRISALSELPERRSTRRFPIVVPLEYKAFRHGLLIREGVGYTLDISSSGILFQTDHPLESGLRLELSVEWPVLHDPRAHRQLHAFAHIVRLSKDQVAVRLVRPKLLDKNAAAGQEN